MSSALDRLKNLTAKISGYEVARKENMKLLESLYRELKIDDKVPHFDELFDFKAINLSGVSLAPDTLGAIKEGKYIQIIAIRYDASSAVKNKNSSLGYFGRAEKVDAALKTKIVSFVLRWRFEKSFMTLEHYHGMLSSLSQGDDL
jgi:phosphoglucomutase